MKKAYALVLVATLSSLIMCSEGPLHAAEKGVTVSCRSINLEFTHNPDGSITETRLPEFLDPRVARQLRPSVSREGATGDYLYSFESKLSALMSDNVTYDDFHKTFDLILNLKDPSHSKFTMRVEECHSYEDLFCTRPLFGHWESSGTGDVACEISGI